MCVCIYEFMSVSVSLYTHECMFCVLCVCAHLCVCVFLCMYACTHSHSYLYVCVDSGYYVRIWLVCWLLKVPATC